MTDTVLAALNAAGHTPGGGFPLPASQPARPVGAHMADKP